MIGKAEFAAGFMNACRSNGLLDQRGRQGDRADDRERTRTRRGRPAADAERREAEVQFTAGSGESVFGDAPDEPDQPPSTPEPDQQTSWGEPDPLVAEEGTEPYPLDALPTGIRDAVEEVVAFVQCPDALAACSALAQLGSVAGQGCANVYRDETLCGPVGLYFLVIAKSGERKSQLDKHFGEGVRRYEREQTEIHRPKKREYLAALANWEARKEGT